MSILLGESWLLPKPNRTNFFFINVQFYSRRFFQAKPFEFHSKNWCKIDLTQTLTRNFGNFEIANWPFWFVVNYHLLPFIFSIVRGFQSKQTNFSFHLQSILIGFKNENNIFGCRKISRHSQFECFMSHWFVFDLQWNRTNEKIKYSKLKKK